MEILRIILQVFQALSGVGIVVMVLLHSPKGDGLGAIGGSAQLFASQKGAESALSKTTSWMAGIFFLVSFILGYYF